jgi:hypothetical protein
MAQFAPILEAAVGYGFEACRLPQALPWGQKIKANRSNEQRAMRPLT